MKKKRIIKTVSMILIAAFIAQDAAWANPQESASVPSQATLGIPTFFQGLRAETEWNKSDYLVKTLRHCSALITLNGSLSWRDKKCRFSLTNISAPVHSTYAAINASCGLKTASYFIPISKGTKKSSSIDVMAAANSINSLNSSGVRLRFTSSTIRRGILILCAGEDLIIFSTKTPQEGFLNNPNANIYSLESRTSSKLALPDRLSVFADFLNYIFFPHMGKRRLSFGNNLLEPCPVLFCFNDVIFHQFPSPLLIISLLYSNVNAEGFLCWSIVQKKIMK